MRASKQLTVSFAVVSSRAQEYLPEGSNDITTRWTSRCSPGTLEPVPGIQLLTVLFRAEVEHPPEDYFFRVVHHGREYHQLSLLSNTYLVPVDEVRLRCLSHGPKVR